MDFKKQVSASLKKASEEVRLHGVELKYKNNGMDILQGKEVIGRLGYAFVTNKFAEYGASFGMNIVFNLSGGELISRVRELQLSYPNFFHEKYFFSFSSLSYLPNKFFKKGTVSFFEQENIGEKCKLIISVINELYVSQIQNFIDLKVEVIEDIFSSPENYGRPLAYILLLSKIHQIDNQEQLISKGKKLRLYDAKADRIDEIIRKIDNL